MKVVTSIVLTLFILTGCTTFQLKKVGTETMWGSYSVATSEDINELKDSNAILWTQDGPILERVEFWKPVGNGEELPIRTQGGKEDGKLKFRSDMTPEEIVELLRTGFSLTASTPTFVGNLQPMAFGSDQGYMIDISLSAKDGADFKGNILFTTQKGKLLVIFFAARETYYYEARKGYFDGIVKSLQSA